MNRSELYYDVVSKREKEQDARRKHFDGMATTVLASSGVIASIMAFTLPNWVSWSLWPAVGVLIAFIAVAFCTICTFWLRKWKFQPKFSDLLVVLTDNEDETIVIWTAKQIVDATQANESHLESKAIWLRRAYVCLSLQVVFLVILIISVGV